MESTKKDPSMIIEEIQVRLDGLRKANWTGHDVIRNLAELGFFKGFSGPRLFQKIVPRLRQDQSEKSHLSEHLVSDLASLSPQPRSIFIESGSTLAYFARALSDFEQLPAVPTVATNNFLVQTLLFEWMGTEVHVTEGALRETYLAYLPFGKQPKEESSPPQIDRDRVAFRRIDRVLSAVDVLYATASTFGFVIGPMTGTRDNAIFKYCMFNNQARRKVKFCIAEPKVFRDSGSVERPRYTWDLNDLESEQSVPRHLHTCFCVFDLDVKTDGRPSHARTSGALLPSKAIDAIALAEDVIRRESPERPNESVVRFHSAPTELGLEREGHLMHHPPVAGVYSTWLTFLDGVQPGTVEIVVGCGTQDTTSELWEVAQEANEFVKAAGYGFRYDRLPAAKREVLHLRVVR